MSKQRRTALVTGGSRGIGRATAIALAKNGFDIAISARTVKEGDHDLSGSLQDTGAKIEAEGARVLLIPMDLSDRKSVAAAADKFLAEFCHCDLLFNNGIYQSEAAEARFFLETPIEEMHNILEGNVIAPAVLIQKLMPSMIERGSGTIINMTSAVTYMKPPGVVGEGGWSMVYAASKGAIDKFSSVLNVEYSGCGIRTFTTEPGFVAYGERLKEFVKLYHTVPVSPPESCAEAILWLVDSPDADKLIDKRINLPSLTEKHGLLPDWDGPGTMYPKDS